MVSKRKVSAKPTAPSKKGKLSVIIELRCYLRSLDDSDCTCRCAVSVCRVGVLTHFPP